MRGGAFCRFRDIHKQFRKGRDMPRTTRTNGGTAIPTIDEPITTSVLDRRELLEAMQRMRAGDFSVRLPGYWSGIDGKIADTFNEIVAANHRISEELRRVGQVVGKEGKTSERASFDQSR